MRGLVRGGRVVGKEGRREGRREGDGARPCGRLEVPRNV